MDRRRTEVVAHRGASGYARENTFAAFDLALRQGADVLELDVRPAADDHLILVHDPTLHRISGDSRAVAGLSRLAIAGIAGPARPATFDDFLVRYARRARLLVDLKDTTHAAEARVIAAIERHRLHRRVVVQSFDLEALDRVRAGAPWLRLAPLVPAACDPLAVLEVTAEFAEGIGVRHDALDAGVARAVRAAGLSLRAWTVDDPGEMRRLLALGVDAIITNVPDVAVAELGQVAA